MDIKLKEEIVNSVLKNEKSFSSRLHLIRSIYNEYNLRISYDYTWLYRNKSVTKEMFNSTVSFDSLSCNKLSCNEWCQLFYELLIFFGISENDILIKSKNYTHKWVEIKLDNMRLIADGTTNYNGHQDIYNCKINDNTSGFVLIENSIPCASLEDLYKAGIIDDDYIIKQGNEFRKIDKELSFFGNKAFDDIVCLINECKSDDKQFIVKLYSYLINYVNSNNYVVLNGSDLTHFLKKRLIDTGILISFLAFFDDDYIETCCRLLLDGSNLFYCEKQQLLLGDVDYNEFKSNMTFVKKS